MADRSVTRPSRPAPAQAPVAPGGGAGDVDQDARELRDLYAELEATDDTSYILSDELRIVRVNPAFHRFAAANAGDDVAARWGRGAAVVDATCAELRPFYQALFARALATGQRFEHDYECSSPQVFRAFRMLVVPVGAYLMVTHSLQVERPHDRAALAADPSYRHNGAIRMCACCRRVRASTAIERWDWVPAYVEAMPRNVSHGLCAMCEHGYHLRT